MPRNDLCSLGTLASQEDGVGEIYEFFKKNGERRIEIHAGTAFRLGAVETLTLSERGLVIGREGVGLQFRTSPGKENTRKRPLF